MIEIVYFIFWFGVWGIIGYFVFYFMFKDRTVIDNLRKNYKTCSQELEEKKQLVEALKKEKEVLVSEIKKCSEQLYYLTQILKDNEIYIKKIKEAAKKTRELYSLLKDFDEDFEKKVKEVLKKVDPSCKISDSEGDNDNNVVF